MKDLVKNNAVVNCHGVTEITYHKCPICGGELEYSSYWQFTKYYKIGKSGKVLSRCKRTDDNGPMEASFITCVNGGFSHGQ